MIEKKKKINKKILSPQNYKSLHTEYKINDNIINKNNNMNISNMNISNMNISNMNISNMNISNMNINTYKKLDKKLIIKSKQMYKKKFNILPINRNSANNSSLRIPDKYINSKKGSKETMNYGINIKKENKEMSIGRKNSPKLKSLSKNKDNKVNFVNININNITNNDNLSSNNIKNIITIPSHHSHTKTVNEITGRFNKHMKYFKKHMKYHKKMIKSDNNIIIMNNFSINNLNSLSFDYMEKRAKTNSNSYKNLAKNKIRCYVSRDKNIRVEQNNEYYNNQKKLHKKENRHNRLKERNLNGVNLKCINIIIKRNKNNDIFSSKSNNIRNNSINIYNFQKHKMGQKYGEHRRKILSNDFYYLKKKKYSNINCNLIKSSNNKNINHESKKKSKTFKNRKEVNGKRRYNISKNKKEKKTQLISARISLNNSFKLGPQILKDNSFNNKLTTNDNARNIGNKNNDIVMIYSKNKLTEFSIKKERKQNGDLNFIKNIKKVTNSDRISTINNNDNGNDTNDVIISDSNKGEHNDEGDKLSKGKFYKEKINIKKEKIKLYLSRILNKKKRKNENPQHVKEYITDIIETLLDEENYFMNKKKYIKPDYLEDKDSELTPEMRTVAVDWLVFINNKIFNFCENTLFLTIQIFDRYLSKSNLTVEKTELLLLTSFIIASKHNEIDYVNMQETLNLAQNKFSKEEIIDMQMSILDKLDFEILAPTMCEYFTLYASFLNLSEKKINHGLYILNIILVDYRMLEYPNFLLALAVMKLITKKFQTKLIKFIKNILSEKKFEKFFEMLDDENMTILQICDKFKILYDAFLETKYKNIQEKFSQKQYNSVGFCTYI